ncbi:MAG: DUF1553 domain-containing protein [Acidobacteria bacterium]|nr:DUF1553 domain-containing protein [Acidobacteriota bacterium]
MVLRVLCLLTAALAFADPFTGKLAPVFTKHCISCHGGKQPAGGLSLASLDKLIEGGKHGHAIVPGDSKSSLLLKYLSGEAQPRMPLGADALPPAVIAEINEAINSLPRQTQAATSKKDPWLYTPPAAPPIPAVSRPDWVRNPVDAFILARLDAKSMTPAPPASRRALLRRVYFDLIGLPPSPGQVAAFEADPSPAAFEKVIDALLADKRYGERWARHWLDLARFAETDGFAIDGERPTAWRYRDYVIRSFQQDKPYDLFVKEQLAGDEIDDKRAGDQAERLVAMGFLRMATWEADANFKTQLRQDFLNEITGAASQVFLGLTAGCARCHDHKYDPIPTRDFYRLQAFFAATRVDERAAPFLPVEDPAAMRRMMRNHEDESDAADAALKEIEKPLRDKHKQAGKSGDFVGALRDKKNTLFTAAEREQWETARNHQRRISEGTGRYRPVAYSVSDIVPPHVPSLPDTYILKGGELSARGEKVEPGFLECVTGKADPAVIPFAGGSAGRRRALAEWIASPANPLTARVMVNRIWQHHFGEGIVRTPSDFGRNGERPTHPELLDWLAREFTAKGWSIKAMHKLMLMSNTYQQSAAHPQWKSYANLDPDNRLLWRMNWQRLESEVLRDTLLSLGGQLESAGGGPGAFFAVGQDVADGFEFFKWFPSSHAEQNRRTIYMFQRRSVMMPMMEVFDGTNMSESCSRRNTTTVAPQAFTLLNGHLTTSAARHFASRITEAAGSDRARQTRLAFELALQRPPSDDEARRAHTVPLERLAVVLFNLNEFIYLE